MDELTLFHEGNELDSGSFYIQPSLIRERDRQIERQTDRQTETDRQRIMP